MPSHRKAQDLAAHVHDTARSAVLRTIAKSLEQLDDLYAKDADALKRHFRKLLSKAGIAARRADQIIDEVFAASRAQRIKVVSEAITKAARAAHGIDRETFESIFGTEGKREGPFDEGPSASPPKRRP